MYSPKGYSVKLRVKMFRVLVAGLILSAFSQLAFSQSLSGSEKKLAADKRRISSVSLLDLRAIAKSEGYKIVSSGDEGDVSLRVRDVKGTGLVFNLIGKSCSKEAPKQCSGVDIQVRYDADGEETLLRINEANLMWAATTAWYSDGTVRKSSPTVGITRYTLLEGGMTVRNFKDEMINLLAIAPQVADYVWQVGDYKGNEVAEAVPKSKRGTAKSGKDFQSAVPKGSSSGSAFFVSSDGLAVTNAHVVENCSSVSAGSIDGVLVIATDEASDLAIVRVVSPNISGFLNIRSGKGLRLGEDILIAGYPLSDIISSDLNITRGTTSSLSGIGNDRRRIQISAPVQPGNSGGPILDMSGNVVGVVVSKLNALAVASLTGDIPQNINFGVSQGTLQSFLDANNVDYTMAESGAARSAQDVAAMAQAATFHLVCHR